MFQSNAFQSNAFQLRTVKHECWTDIADTQAAVWTMVANSSGDGLPENPIVDENGNYLVTENGVYIVWSLSTATWGTPIDTGTVTVWTPVDDRQC